MSAEVLVLPAFGQGHLLPCMELCKVIASRNYKATLVIFSTLSSSVPSNFRQHPLIDIVDVPAPPGATVVPMHPDSPKQLLLYLENHISASKPPPLCAIVDVLIVLSWTVDLFNQFHVPTIGFFTSGACSAALEYAIWKNQVGDVRPGEIRLLPGLPEEMGVTASDLKRRPAGPPRGGPPGGKPGSKKKGGMFVPGAEPYWTEPTQSSLALMINTCDDLERPFIDYLSAEVKKPVWGVGPLFPDQYWNSAGSLINDSESRTNRSVNVTEEAIVEWLNSKPRGSVLYVAFGSSVDITKDEYPHLADALEESTHPFIWVLRTDAGRAGPPSHGATQEEGYYPHGLEAKVGDRGLIIRGWAPQLLILSHPSIGGFLSHCGWNSTMEAIGRGVPFLALPLRGDQYYDAKLVTSYLKIGYDVPGDTWEMIKKDDIPEGINKLMEDKEMKKRAEALGAKFENGFPASSVAALDVFISFIKQK